MIPPTNALGLCARGAALNDWSPAEERSLADLGFSYLAQSISLGLDLKRINLKLMPCLLKYHETAQYKALFEIPKSANAPPQSVRLVDPGDDKQVP
jgi:hypothetical protein